MRATRGKVGGGFSDSERTKKKPARAIGACISDDANWLGVDVTRAVALFWRLKKPKQGGEGHPFLDRSMGLAWFRDLVYWIPISLSLTRKTSLWKKSF